MTPIAPILLSLLICGFAGATEARVLFFTTVHNANIGSIFGIGFPAWTGGALKFVNSVGVAKFVTRADQLAVKYCERFTPPRLLRDKAAQGEALR